MATLFFAGRDARGGGLGKGSTAPAMVLVSYHAIPGGVPCSCCPPCCPTCPSANRSGSTLPTCCPCRLAHPPPPGPLRRPRPTHTGARRPGPATLRPSIWRGCARWCRMRTTWPGWGQHLHPQEQPQVAGGRLPLARRGRPGGLGLAVRAPVGPGPKPFVRTNVKMKVGPGGLGSRRARRPAGRVRGAAGAGAWPRAWPCGTAVRCRSVPDCRAAGNRSGDSVSAGPGRASRTFCPRWKEALSMTTTRGTPRSGGRACRRKSTKSSPFQVRAAAHQVRGGGVAVSVFASFSVFSAALRSGPGAARAASTFTRRRWGLSWGTSGRRRYRHQVWVGGRQGLKPVSSRKKRSRSPARAFF